MSPVENTRLGSKDKRISLVRGSKGHQTMQWTSSVVNHANSNQHKASMMHLKADLAKAITVTSFLPIACCNIDHLYYATGIGNSSREQYMRAGQSVSISHRFARKTTKMAKNQAFSQILSTYYLPNKNT